MKELLAALIEAQKEFKPLAKSGNNPHFRTQYSTGEDINNAVLDALLAHGIVIVQRAETKHTETGLSVEVDTRLYHAESERSIGNTLALPVEASKNTVQAIGSAITYARRYSLLSILNLTPDDDDDGNANQRSESPQKPQEARPAPSQAKPTIDTLGNTETVRKAFHAVGTAYWDKGWDKARGEFVAKKGYESSNDLPVTVARAFIDLVNAKLVEREEQLFEPSTNDQPPTDENLENAPDIPF